MKEYHISLFEDDAIKVVTKDINRKGVDYMKDDFKNAWKKRYILEVGDKVIDIFGNLVTIKEILHHEDTESTNYLIEENGNCYRPTEFAGLFVKYLSDVEFENLITQK